MPLLFPSLERGNSPELYHSLRYWGLGVLARGEAPAAAARDKLKVVFLCAFCSWRETCMSSLLRHVTLFLSPEQSLPRLMSIEVVNAFLLHWLAAYIAADKPAHNWGGGGVQNSANASLFRALQDWSGIAWAGGRFVGSLPPWDCSL